MRISDWSSDVCSSDLLWPTGMVSVLNGSIDDGYNGLLGWMWNTCAVTTIGLVVVTRLALQERQYSAVMAATGLLYPAILTAFGPHLSPEEPREGKACARTWRSRWTADIYIKNSAIEPQINNS